MDQEKIFWSREKGWKYLFLSWHNVPSVDLKLEWHVFEKRFDGYRLKNLDSRNQNLNFRRNLPYKIHVNSNLQGIRWNGLHGFL